MSDIKSLAELQEMKAFYCVTEFDETCYSVLSGLDYEQHLCYTDDNCICSEHDYNSLINLEENGYDIYNIDEFTGDKNKHLAWLTALNDMRNDPMFNEDGL